MKPVVMGWSDRLAVWLALGFGTGLAPYMPGSFGSALGLVLAWLVLSMGGMWSLLAAVLVFSVVGIWAAQRYEQLMSCHDASEIVIDEIAGQMLSCLILLPWLDPDSYGVWVGVFLAFRLFDILKPWPISWLDRRIGGGLGVMADDWAAGCAAGGLGWMVLAYFDTNLAGIF